MYFTCYMTFCDPTTVLWYPKYYLVSPLFMHSEYKKDHTYLLALTTTVLLNLNYLKFGNKILPFRKFHYLFLIYGLKKQGAVFDKWTTQDRKSLFSVQATSWEFSDWVKELHWRIQSKLCVSKNGIARQYCIYLGK